MNEDHRQTWGLIIDVLDVLEKHGYRRGDDQHTGRAVGPVGDLARIYEGTQEVPAGAYLVEMPEQRRARPDQAWPADSKNAETIAATGIFTILSALDEASDYKRDRAAGCADCADESCGTCQHRLDAARAYESLAARLQHAIDGVTPDKPSRQGTAGPPGKRIQPQAVQEREAEQ
jgi:hypothetical protein